MTSTNTRTEVAAEERPGPARSADSTADVPTAAAVIRSCVVSSVADRRHPLLAAVTALAAQHRRHIDAGRLTCDPLADDRSLAIAVRAIAAADVGRAVLANRIDQWAYTTLPVNRRAAVHTESLGHLVDRLVGAWTMWKHADDGEGPAAGDLASTLLYHVSELSIGYDDLLADLRSGCRRLPRHQNPLAA